MENHGYDITDPQSILNFAKRLAGRTLAEVLDETILHLNAAHKGNLGTLVEKFYFKHMPPNDNKPDFTEAGVELKTTGVRRNSQAEFIAKERLVLTMINFMTLPSEEWESSSLMQKCALMLLLFYQYEPRVSPLELRFVLEPVLWSFPEEDLIQIRKDWETIRDKVRAGKAHELSEGDTLYLGACRKGSGGPNEALRSQLNSHIDAKSRAFSLKSSYLNQIISQHGHVSKLLVTEQDKKLGIEEALQRNVESYIGKTVEELALLFGYTIDPASHKGYHRHLGLRILGVEGTNVEEFEKAGIEVKVLRRKRNGTPHESISFPHFKYMNIVNEEWEDSVFAQRIEQKFLFVVFQTEDDGILRFKGIQFWNMPFEDRETARDVWFETRKRIRNHMAEDLPKASENRVAHVRPHGRDSKDVLPTPQGDYLGRKSFWLNNRYIGTQLTL